MYVVQSIRSESGYPVPGTTIETKAIGRGLSTNGDVTSDILKSREYRLVLADIYFWLATVAPNFSQGDYSVGNITEEDKKRLIGLANAIYDELGDDAALNMVYYGYKGSDL